jgi:hypothetical protein
MAVVLKNELCKKFSNYVKEYLDKGYFILPGISSEAVVLSNHKDENDRISIRYTESYDRNYLCTLFKITVTQHKIDRGSRFFFQNGEPLHCDCFYCIREFYNGIRKDVFVSSEEELLQIRSLVRDRKQNAVADNVKIITDVKLKNVPLPTQFKIMDRIRSVRGFKKATYNNITKIQLVKVDKNKIYVKVCFELNDRFDFIILR